MHKKVMIIFCVLLSSFSLFAKKSNLMYSYEFNRFGEGHKDVLFGTYVNFHSFDYKFRNTEERKTETDKQGTLGFINAELTERFKGFSIYQNMEYSNVSISMNNKSVLTKTVLLRLGYQKDFLWIFSEQALTAFTGVSAVLRFDSTNKNIYKNTIFAGLGLKIGLNYPIFNNEGNTVLLFIQYLADLFFLQNASSVNSGFSANTGNFSFAHTLCFGLKLNINTITQNINNRRVQKMTESITNPNS